MTMFAAARISPAFVLLAVVLTTGLAHRQAIAVPLATTTHGADGNSLDAEVGNGDLLDGLLGVERPGDKGWHPANTQPAGQLPALTDGIGINGLAGLLNDFPGAGTPTKLLEYDLGALTDISAIRILSGNDGKDGRVFSTTVIRSSSDGLTFDLLGYFQSDPSGTINSGQWGSTLVDIVDDLGGDLLSNVRHLQFDFYAVDNTGGQMRDPFDGVNPFTGTDDGLTAPFVAPLILEIDVIGTRSAQVPAPATLALMGLGLAGLGLVRRRKRA